MKKKILLVEDDVDIRELLRDVLEGEDYLVITAPNGAEGLEVAERENPDFILLDLMMPVVDGYAFMERFRGDCPVVVLTAVGEGAEKPKQAAGIIFKPLHIEELLMLLKRHGA